MANQTPVVRTGDRSVTAAPRGGGSGFRAGRFILPSQYGWEPDFFGLPDAQIPLVYEIGDTTPPGYADVDFVSVSSDGIWYEIGLDGFYAMHAQIKVYEAEFSVEAKYEILTIFVQRGGDTVEIGSDLRPLLPNVDTAIQTHATWPLKAGDRVAIMYGARNTIGGDGSGPSYAEVTYDGSFSIFCIGNYVDTSESFGGVVV